MVGGGKTAGLGGRRRGLGGFFGGVVLGGGCFTAFLRRDQFMGIQS